MFQIKIHVFYYNFEVKHFSFILLSNVYGRKSVTLKHFLISYECFLRTTEFYII